MHIKTYNSFSEINGELEILKVEKELNYHKLVLSFETAKENFQPQSIKREVFGYVKEKLLESYKSFLVIGIPYLLKFLKTKRG